MRIQYTEELNHLNQQMIEMGALCENAITHTGDSLLHGNHEEAESVHRIHEEILQKEKSIETLCLRLLLQQQPMARDLRQISAALKMITDMKRIGEVASDTADIILYMQRFHRMEDIEDLCQKAVMMVHQVIESFVKQDLTEAESVIAYDDIVDALFVKVKQDLVQAIQKNPQYADDYVDLLMIAKYFEKIGDHAVNISKWVVYSMTGELKETAV
ncbi:MAG: phosphate signaling complex protein PhoU [Solobacterium sp.]|jgi:phosphate transport system protein|nr:phosphate signaling complex protein PhoU [Solobacterium sp.]MCH4205844.1 phosphate signaling complex protein PhoU [Solobacterium sp.]MCH4227371.1 phosphate signaling complex protein PhoU [Solobacterium sp.]MCH4282632.1 phosphate signaling complex protein PhoU [Solobacterium sp.]